MWVAGARGFLAVGIAAAALASGAPVAQAVGIIAPQHDPPQSGDGWQAGTCTSDTPECSVDTPGQFFTQAAGHPNVGFTQFIVANGPPGQTPVGNIKTLRVDLPVGLSVNPQATPQCALSIFETNALLCPAGSQVGTSAITVSILGIPAPPTPPLTLVPVYNIDPPNGESARFGFNAVGSNVYLRAGVAWDGDYHEYFTIDAPKPPAGVILKNRLVFNGQAGDGTFITTPSTCFDPSTSPYQHVYSTFLRADSYESPNPNFPDGSPFIESSLPPGTAPTGCAKVPFDPTVSVKPGVAQTDSPDGTTVGVNVPFDPSASIANSNLKTAKVTLPPGMGLNPSAANGLQACTDAQFGKGTTNPVACPAASQIGTVSIQTPPLPPDSLPGNVYLGQPLGNDPTSGDEFRIFVDAESARYGISARLIGHVSADPQTGQLTTTFADNPQVPFSSFQLHFDGGPTAALSTPDTCGPHTTTTALTPWSGNPDATPSGSFTLSSAPGGGSCPKALAARPFAPSFAAASLDKQGGAFTDFTVNLTRPDGAQELKRINVDLPPGLVARLAGVSYCPEAAIAAAATHSGAAEKSTPSCPDQSLIGTVGIEAGAGSSPLHIDGKVYLAGPYKGAPLSLVVVTPATAGPFDLGTVVVRVALHVDPTTAQIHAVSDPIPHVFGGVKLDIRSVEVRIDRDRFALNPTNCDPMAVGGALFGGAADPSNPAAFFPDPVSTPFQVRGCDRLSFGPKLFLRLYGHKKDFRRNGHPKLRGVLITQSGDANISRVAVTLPKGVLLDQSHIRTVCTRAQFAASACPADSVYGYATAFTPLLDKPLSGPVYLMPGNNPLPDLVAALHGQVDFNLVGRIDVSRKAQLRSTFDAVPDVPVSKFVLLMQGGKRGLLVPSRNLCAKRYKVVAKISGQNGKTANQRPKLRIPCR